MSYSGTLLSSFSISLELHLVSSFCDTCVVAMALLGAEYASSDEGVSPPPLDSSQNFAATSVIAAPEVSVDVWSHNVVMLSLATNIMQDPMRLQMMLAKPTDTSLTYNVRYEDLSRPAQGPINPFKTTEGNALKHKNVLTGYAEEAVISDSTFTNQHRTFQSRGYAQEPNSNGNIVGDLVTAQQYGGRDVVQAKSDRRKRKRQEKGDPRMLEGDNRYLGPWAKYQEDVQYEDDADFVEEELASDEEYLDEAIVPEKMEGMGKLGTDYQEDLSSSETTEFNGSSQYDYQGRTYMHAPRDIDIDLYKEGGVDKSYIPKKLVHTWRHGTKPINKIRFFPNTAHLLLSASADAKIKIFDVYRDKELLRTYSGHTKSISDIDFSPDGTQFLSASFDRQMKL